MVTVESVVGEIDIFTTTTGNFKIITLEHMKKMRNSAIVGDIGHCDNEIEMGCREKFEGIKLEDIKPQVDRYGFLDVHGIIALAAGRLLNLGCVTGHPSFRMSCSFTFQVNETSIINYVSNSLPQLASRAEIAFTLARRFGLPGADELFQRQFNQAFASGDYKGAATVEAQCKSGLLRTPQTIPQFKSAQAPPGQPSPILHYFITLLEYGKRNALGSLELVRQVVAQKKRDLIEKWQKEEKLECTEEDRGVDRGVAEGGGPRRGTGRRIEEWQKEEKLECTEELGDVVKPRRAARPCARRTRSSAVAKVAAERPPPSPQASTCLTRACR